MKVVINKCHGGFGISNEALLRLIEKKSSIIQKMTIQEYYGGAENQKDKFCYSPDWKEKYKQEDKRWHKPFKDGYKSSYFGGQLFKGKFVYFIERDDEIRNHPDLVEVVKSMKKEANGEHASLEVKEIPDGIEWQIEEYDGLEWVAEKHKTWG